MSDQINVALIGAIQAVTVAAIGMISGIIVALLNRRRQQAESIPEDGGNVVPKRRFTSSKAFIWLVAPAVGATLTLAAFGAWQAMSTSSAIKAPFCLHGYFYPSGFMNEPKEIEIADPWKTGCHSGPTCLKITFKSGLKTWAGIYWQYPDGNWGDGPGRKIEGAKKIVFWARGQSGGETVDFKAGGINAGNKKYRDSFEKILDTKVLSTDWQRYEIDLDGADTSSVIGAFSLSVQKSANPETISIYLDGICYQ